MRPQGCMPDTAWSVAADAVSLTVRLTPKADRDAIGGLIQMADGRTVLAARVRAVPENGKANKALAVLIAKRLKLAKSSVTLAGGATSRIKVLRIDDASQATLDRLAALVE